MYQINDDDATLFDNNNYTHHVSTLVSAVAPATAHAATIVNRPNNNIIMFTQSTHPLLNDNTTSSSSSSSSSSSWLSVPFLHTIDPHYHTRSLFNHNNIDDDNHVCKAILYDEIRDTKIRVWDAMIFLPNLLFFLYLLWRFKQSRERVRQLNAFPILRNFYIFMYLCVGVSMLRCLVSVVMKVHTTGGDTVDKIFWVIVRFFLLSTEISVLVFGLFSGHLDVRQSIRRILTITLLIALVYSVCQGLFEIIAPDASFYVASIDYYLYGHGGMAFWFATSMASFAIYTIVVLLPWSPCRNRLLLPTKRSFYMYAAILSLLNIVQAIGALIFYLNYLEGLCIVDATTYLYFTVFTPLVYFTFLSPFLAIGGTNSAASALVTTTVGSEHQSQQQRQSLSHHHHQSSLSQQNRSGSSRRSGGTNDSTMRQAPAPLLNRPTNLFTAGLRGAVNFSYRPQVDDLDLLDDDDFTSSIGSVQVGGNANGGGLHFDHYGPYAYNQQSSRHNIGYGYGRSGAIIPRDVSSFSIQSSTGTVTTFGQSVPLMAATADTSSKLSTTLMQQQQQQEQQQLQSSSLPQSSIDHQQQKSLPLEQLHQKKVVSPTTMAATSTSTNPISTSSFTTTPVTTIDSSGDGGGGGGGGSTNGHQQQPQHRILHHLQSRHAPTLSPIVSLGDQEMTNSVNDGGNNGRGGRAESQSENASIISGSGNSGSSN